MQRGVQCPGSGRGYPHGKDQKIRRRERAAARAKASIAIAVARGERGAHLPPPERVEPETGYKRARTDGRKHGKAA